jgi:hypothetical protein
MGKDNITEQQFFTRATGTIGGNPREIFKGRARLQGRHNVFSQRVVNTWNNLPASVAEANTVNIFKSRIDSYWSRHGYTIGQP